MKVNDKISVKSILQIFLFYTERLYKLHFKNYLMNVK